MNEIFWFWIRLCVCSTRSHWSIIYSLLKNYCCLKGFQSNYFQIGTKLYLKSINVNSKIHWFSGHRNKQDKQGRIILFFNFLARFNFLKKLMLEKYGKASISWTHKKGEICTGQSWWLWHRDWDEGPSISVLKGL